GCLMALTGLLFFFQRARSPQPIAFGVAVRLGALALVFLVAHALAWMVSAAPPSGFDLSWAGAMFGTRTGHMEIGRVVAAALAVWALVIARRTLLALLFATIALEISGGIGHPVTMQPLWTIPSKAIHLCAGAAWLGGLLWLTLADRSDIDTFAGEARRASSVALASVVLVVFSGTIQARFFLASWAGLVARACG